MEVSRTIKNRTTIRPGYTVLGHISKDSIFFHRDYCMSMFTASIYNNKEIESV